MGILGLFALWYWMRTPEGQQTKAPPDAGSGTPAPANPSGQSSTPDRQQSTAPPDAGSGTPAPANPTDRSGTPDRQQLTAPPDAGSGTPAPAPKTPTVCAAANAAINLLQNGKFSLPAVPPTKTYGYTADPLLHGLPLLPTPLVAWSDVSQAIAGARNVGVLLGNSWNYDATTTIILPDTCIQFLGLQATGSAVRQTVELQVGCQYALSLRATARRMPPGYPNPKLTVTMVWKLGSAVLMDPTVITPSRTFTAYGPFLFTAKAISCGIVISNVEGSTQDSTVFVADVRLNPV
jgi:hypothetical protein